MRDVFFHTQWCAALAMVAVQWPEFICNQHLSFLRPVTFSDVVIRPPSHANGVGYPLVQCVPLI